MMMMMMERAHGKMTPPREDPDATMPKASALRFRNHEPTGPVAAENTAATPKALRTDCGRRIW